MIRTLFNATLGGGGGGGQNICMIKQLNENLSLSVQLIMTRIVFVIAVLTNDRKRILINLTGARHIV